MGTEPLQRFRVLIVPGLNGSGVEHWQSHWERRFPYFERVHQLAPHIPDLPVWSAQLDSSLRQSDRPALIVAHSFGCLATVDLLRIGAKNVVAALLVAPADPWKFGVASALKSARLPCPSIVVGSMNDPWMRAQSAADWAHLWGSEFINAGYLGHINAESELADWPSGIALLTELAETAGTAPKRHYVGAQT